jgi:hypothetical protein
VALLRLLLGARPNLAFKDHTGRDALWFAALAGNQEMIAALLGAGMQEVPERQSPLFAAVRSAGAGALERLLRGGFEVDARDSDGDTPLIAAAVRGDVAVLHVLIEHGAAVNAQNEAGDTALILAARAGNTGVCKDLLAAGANAGLRNEERIDALDTAKRRNLPQIAALLDPQ